MTDRSSRNGREYPEEVQACLHRSRKYEVTDQSEGGGGSPTRPLRATRTRETRAQGLLLEAVLKHQPLPGIDRVVTLPDLGPDIDPSTFVVVDDRDPATLGFPPQVRVVGQDALGTLQLEDELRVLRFLQPQLSPGTIGLRLQLSIALPDGGVVPLEGILATFRDSDPLTAEEPTHILAF